MKRKVLVVDIGGTHVKLLMSVRDQRDFASGNGVCFKGQKIDPVRAKKAAD